MWAIWMPQRGRRPSGWRLVIGVGVDTDFLYAPGEVRAWTGGVSRGRGERAVSGDRVAGGARRVSHRMGSGGGDSAGALDAGPHRAATMALDCTMPMVTHPLGPGARTARPARSHRSPCRSTAAPTLELRPLALPAPRRSRRRRHSSRLGVPPGPASGLGASASGGERSVPRASRAAATAAQQPSHPDHRFLLRPWPRRVGGETGEGDEG